MSQDYSQKNRRQVEDAFDAFRRWYLPSDEEVVLAVRTIKEFGRREEKDTVFTKIMERLSQVDSGPDYDHFYQLEDGRMEMHYNHLDAQTDFCIELLKILADPRTVQSLKNLPSNAYSLPKVKLFLSKHTD